MQKTGRAVLRWCTPVWSVRELRSQPHSLLQEPTQAWRITLEPQLWSTPSTSSISLLWRLVRNKEKNEIKCKSIHLKDGRGYYGVWHCLYVGVLTLYHPKIELISINWYHLVHFKWLSLKLPGCNRTPKEGDFTFTKPVKLLYQHSCTSGIDGCLSGQRSWHHHHCHRAGCAWRPCDQTLSECSPIPKHLTGVLHVPIWHCPEDRLAKLTRGRKHLQLQSNKWAMSFV